MVSLGDGTGPMFSRDERGHAPTFEELVGQRLSRRGLLKASVVVSALASAAPLARASAAPAQQSPTPSSFGVAAGAQEQFVPTLGFTPIRPDTTDEITVSPGYRSQVLIKWGDPLFPGVPPLDLNGQTAALQERQFGFNCDFVAFLPLPQGSNNPFDGLLWVNHEYTDGPMMFPGYDAKNPTQEQVDVELAAHGGSVVRVLKNPDGTWFYDQSSAFNRRFTANTPMLITGPAAGTDLMKTESDPSGTRGTGMLNNCGGGVTPWGTILTAEENFNQYFANAGALSQSEPLFRAHRRYGIPSEASERLWERYYPSRFDVTVSPNEPFKFGWIVEIDPYNPSSTPMKRTALGRTKHEAAAMTLSKTGRAVVYLGDDERFDYVYKFVSAGTFDPESRANNLKLLDEGTLYVARLHEDGTGEWMPLTFGEGPLTPSNGFSSQAEVLVKARLAGDAVGATKMDRPEDVEVNPATGKVYAVMTNNTQRGTDNRPGTDAANPRARNAWGHILEISEAGNDPAATSFGWEVFLLAGDPNDESTYFAGFSRDQVSPIANPDNIAFDGHGNLWIATDGQPSSLKVNDGIFGVPTSGPDRGQVKQLLSAVPGAEVASLFISPSSQDLFATIQHPGEGGSLAEPRSSWPTGREALPSVVVVNRPDGRPVGT